MFLNFWKNIIIEDNDRRFGSASISRFMESGLEYSLLKDFFKSNECYGVTGLILGRLNGVDEKYLKFIKKSLSGTKRVIL